jgi:AbrB family looped-hinge helix DNA binding protein
MPTQWQIMEVRARLGSGGRLVIPSEYRRALGVAPGDEVILVLEEGAVRVLTPREAVRRAQSLVRRYVAAGARLADELIQDRRREARRESRRP